MVSSLLTLSCQNKLPDFPAWTPYIAIYSDGVKLNCTLDSDKMVFNCDGKNPIQISPTDNGDFCTPKDQIAGITTWVREAKKKYDKECNVSLSRGR